MPDEMRQKRQDFGIYPENLPVVDFFLNLQTQWRISPMGQRIGLDYAAVIAAATPLGVDITAELFKGIQLMELSMINGQKK